MGCGGSKDGDNTKKPSDDSTVVDVTKLEQKMDAYFQAKETGSDHVDAYADMIAVFNKIEFNNKDLLKKIKEDPAFAGKYLNMAGEIVDRGDGTTEYTNLTKALGTNGLDILTNEAQCKVKLADSGFEPLFVWLNKSTDELCEAMFESPDTEATLAQKFTNIGGLADEVIAAYEAAEAEAKVHDLKPKMKAYFAAVKNDDDSHRDAYTAFVEMFKAIETETTDSADFKALAAKLKADPAFAEQYVHMLYKIYETSKDAGEKPDEYAQMETLLGEDGLNILADETSCASNLPGAFPTGDYDTTAKICAKIFEDSATTFEEQMANIGEIFTA